MVLASAVVFISIRAYFILGGEISGVAHLRARHNTQNVLYTKFARIPPTPASSSYSWSYSYAIEISNRGTSPSRCKLITSMAMVSWEW